VSGAVRVEVAGEATDEETAAILATVAAFTSGGTQAGDPRPAAYRSAWRAAAIQQAAERPPLVYGVPASARMAGS
jgi:hypothetical protein